MTRICDHCGFPVADDREKGPYCNYHNELKPSEIRWVWDVEAAMARRWLRGIERAKTLTSRQPTPQQTHERDTLERQAS
jgi:hypothetical protein